MSKYTPSSLAAELDALVRGRYPGITLQAEVGQLIAAASGHRYLTLRDQNAQISATIWRDDWRRMAFKPKQGELVEARGRLSIYGRKGNYQIAITKMSPAGEGQLARKIAEIKARLAADGLLEPSRRRALPRFPRVVGVVTSLSGAALQDFLEVSRVRHPSARILVSGSVVQGDAAPPAIVKALELLIQDGRSEVIVLTRGGGSKEDLLCFQDEDVARAIARCPVPVVSAVGHQIDTTIADLVADAVEPTPSAAAARVFPDDEALKRRVDEASLALERALAWQLGRHKQRLKSLQERLRHPGERLAEYRRQHGVLTERLQRALITAVERRRSTLRVLEQRLEPATSRQIARSRARLERDAARLDALSPLAVLGRGYAIARSSRGVVTQVADVADGDALMIRVADGEFLATVGEGKPQLTLF